MSLIENFKNLPTLNKIGLGLYASLIGITLFKGEDESKVLSKTETLGSRSKKKSFDQKFNEAVARAKETGKTQYIRIDDGGRTKMIKVNPTIL